MKNVALCGMAIAYLGLSACSAPPLPPPAASELKTITLDESVSLAVGATVYVPVYSYIYMMSQGQKMDLTATLSIRNTDRSEPIIVRSVEYYDGNGALVQAYLDSPVELGALSATEFVVEQSDRRGGAGASFLVDWVAQSKVSEPVVEVIMINTRGNQGLSFVSQGRVIDSLDTQN